MKAHDHLVEKQRDRDCDLWGEGKRMGFSEAVAWWEDWQVRILVLTSQFLQIFLLCTAALRKHRIPGCLRFLIWIAFLGSDAVAIYALAALYNRQKKPDQTDTNVLQVAWASILLLHLAGQDAITAYNIEDNELWRRHVVTAVCQVTVTTYVFCKSWELSSVDNRGILTGAILMFIAGTINCLLKPWDLKRVSINSLVDSSRSQETDQLNLLHEYIRAATEYTRTCNGGQPSIDRNGYRVIKKFYGLFVDLAPAYSDRLSLLKLFLLNPNEAHYCVQLGLSISFNRLYTKGSISGINCKLNSRYHLRILSACLFGAGIGTLSIETRERHSYYNHTDVKITYALLLLTFVFQLLMPSVMLFNKLYQRCSQRRGTLVLKGVWSDQVAQYNLLGYLARNKKHRKIRKLATLLVCKDYLDQIWCMKSSNLSRDITQLIYDYIKAGWLEINNIATYRKFNDNRGQWTLDCEGLLSNLGWSLRRPFDETVLLWHLATDFTFYHMDTPPANEAARRSREMSNYMVYLLFVNPEMLMAGARRSLFKDTYQKLKDMTADGNPPLSEKEITQNITKGMMGTPEGQGVVHDAWKIAQELIVASSQWEDENKMWRAIQGVWVEMLCFSAGRCRGYLHAKSLGKGGEYLSYVWLLLLYMGMETLAEKMQRTGLHEEGDIGVGTDIGLRAASSKSVIPGDNNV